MKSSSLSRYFNSTTVFAFGYDDLISVQEAGERWLEQHWSSVADGLAVCREGSVVAHLWVGMSVPSSRAGTVTVEKVSRSLQKGLRRYSAAPLAGYTLHLPSLSVTGESEAGSRACSRSRKCVSLISPLFCSPQKPIPKL